MRSLTALSAFLDVSSLNLTAPQAPSFFSPCSILGRRANGVREPCDEAGDAVADCGEAGQPLDSAFVHVQLAGDLDLQRMDALTWPTIVARDVAAGIRVVAPHAVAQVHEQKLHQPREAGCAGRTMGVAEDEIGGPRPRSGR